MRNILVILLTVVAAAVCGPVGGLCLAAIPDQSLDALTAAATHILTGKVVRIYTAVEPDGSDWEKTYFVAAVQVARQEKGPAVGRLAYVRYWRQRYTGDGPAPPGHYGLRNLPAKGEALRFFARLADDGGLDALEPNGIQPMK